MYAERCVWFVAELLVDKAMELKYVGGVYGGNVKPAPFLCLILKMLQIQPEKDIIVEFISQPDFKWVNFSFGDSWFLFLCVGYEADRYMWNLVLALLWQQ